MTEPRFAGLRCPRSGPDVRSPTPGLRELDLSLPLRVALSVFVRAGFEAVRAGNPDGIFRRHQVALHQWMAACAAEFPVAHREAVRHRNPLVEDEALALPQALLRWNLLKV